MPVVAFVPGWAMALAWSMAMAAGAGLAAPAAAAPAVPAPAATTVATDATDATDGTDAAETKARRVREQLAQPAVLRGRFEQSKQLEGFEQPLVSRGDFLLVRDRGVAWDTREPFASTTLLTRDRLLTRLPDGSQRVLLDAAQSPGTAAVNALLMALLAGDLDSLAGPFSLAELVADEGRWGLVMQPRDEALQQVFRRIRMEGDRFVREVRLEETGGDVTTLRFLDLSDTPAQPTADEAARFD